MLISNANVATATNNKSAITSDTGETPENGGNVTCKEVPIVDVPEEMNRASGMRLPFDLKGVITGENYEKTYNFNTYVFSGKVVSLKEFEVSWTDDK